MANVRILTLEDFAFIEQLDALAPVFDRLRTAKKLVEEARVIARPILARLSLPAAVSAAKKKSRKRRKPVEVSYGVDVPPALTDDERAVRAAAMPLAVSKNEIQAKTKLSWGRIDRALSSLRKRGLMEAKGNTVNRRWKGT